MKQFLSFFKALCYMLITKCVFPTMNKITSFDVMNKFKYNFKLIM